MTQSLDLLTGNIVGTPDPIDWGPVTLKRRDAQRIAGDATVVFWPGESFYFTRPHQLSAASLAGEAADQFVVDRASAAWEYEWSGVSGAVAGPLSEYGTGTVRIGPDGALIEEGVSNLIADPAGEGFVAGSPGTLPAGWALINAPSPTLSIDEDVDGFRRLNIRLNGTPTSSPLLYLGNINWTSGQSASWQAGLTLVAGSMTNVDQIALDVRKRDSGGSSLGQEAQLLFTPDAYHRRYLHESSPTDASLSYVQPRLRWNWTSGPIDITLGISLPHFGQKGHAHTAVRPAAGTTGVSTRGGDKLALANGSWWNASAGTLIVHGRIPVDQPGKVASVAFLRTATSRGIGIHYEADPASRSLEFRMRNDAFTVYTDSTPAGSFAAGDAFVAVMTWDASEFIGAANGTARSPVAISGAFTAPALWIGRGYSGGAAPDDAYFNGYIERVDYLPIKLSSAEAAARSQVVESLLEI